MGQSQQALFMDAGGITSPLQISGCTYWMDASDSSTVTPNTSGATVTSWTDKSATALTMTKQAGTPTYQLAVQNGKNIVRFPGTTAWFNSGASGSANAMLNNAAGFTVFNLNKPTGFTANQATFDLLFSNQARAVLANTLSVTSGFSNSGGQINSGSALVLVTNSTARSTSVFQVSSVIANYSSGPITEYLNNVQTATATFLSSLGVDNTGKTVTLSSGDNAGSLPFGGDMAEIIVYSRALSLGEQTAVYNYLKAKWGL